MIKLLAARRDFAGLKPHVARYQELNPGDEMAALLADLEQG